MDPDDLKGLVDAAAEKLGEQFDAVQILASGPRDGGGTRCFKSGSGNWYARQGMAHEFIEEDRANEHAAAQKRAND
jgi:hypothetical protein